MFLINVGENPNKILKTLRLRCVLMLEWAISGVKVNFMNFYSKGTYRFDEHSTISYISWKFNSELGCEV